MRFPKGGLLGRIAGAVEHISELRISIYASHACYFMVLAVFPLLILLLGLLRYTGIQVDNLTALLDGFLPEVLMPGAERLILSTYYNTSGTVLSLSAVTALWSASRGVYGLLSGLNSVYETREDRGWFYTRWVCLLYTFAFLLVLVLTLVLHVFGTGLMEWIAQRGTVLWRIVNLRFFVLLFAQSALFTAVFTVLPNRKNRIRDSLPGALLASAGWLTFSDLYSLYVERFSDYASVYGSVYGVALSMLWLYCCVSIVFYGGALNHYLAEKR